MAPRERAVAAQGVLAALLAGERGAQLAAAGDAEVERGADPLAGEGEAMPRRIAGEPAWRRAAEGGELPLH